MAVYDLELQRMQKAGEALDAAGLEKAANRALYETQELNGGAALATAPRIAQQGIGRVAMMYKSYGIQMYYTLFKTADRVLDRFRSTKKFTAEEHQIARRQIAGVLISSAMLAVCRVCRL